MVPLTTTFVDGDAMRPLDFVVTEGLVSTIGLGQSGTVNAPGDATAYGKGSAGHEAGVVNREIGNGPGEFGKSAEASHRLMNEALRTLLFADARTGSSAAGLDGTEHQRVHPHTAPPGAHMDAHQFVAELVLMGRSHTEREEGRATGATRCRGPKIPVAHERGVAGVPERLKEERLVAGNRPCDQCRAGRDGGRHRAPVAKEASSPYGATTGR